MGAVEVAGEILDNCDVKIKVVQGGRGMLLKY